MNSPEESKTVAWLSKAFHSVRAFANSLRLRILTFAKWLRRKIGAITKSPTIMTTVWSFLKFLSYVLIIGFLVLRQCNDLVVVVEPIALPDSLTSNGHSSTVFTDKMISELQRLLILRDGSDGKPVPTIATLLPECITIRPFLEDLKRDYVNTYPYSTKIQAKREGLSYDKLAADVAFYFDKYFPWHSWKTVEVRGEIHQDGSLYRLALTGTFREGSTYTSQTILSGDPRHFSEISGMALARFAAPWTYVSSTIFKNYDQASAAIDMIHQEFKEQDSSLGISLKGYSNLYAGKISRRRRNVRSADKLFDEALKLSPANYWALVGQAEANTSIYDYFVRGPKTAIQMSALRKAEADLKRAIEVDRANPHAYIQLSYLYWFIGKAEESIAYRAQSLEKARKRGEYVRAMAGLILLKLTSSSSKDRDEAEKEFKELTRTVSTGASEYSALQYVRGFFAVNKGDWDDIRTLTGELLRDKNWCPLERLADNIATASTEQTGLDAQQRFLHEADFLFNQMSEGGVSNFHFNNTWGETLASLGKYEQAIEKFKKALEHYGDHVRALGHWGQALMEQGKFNEAETKFRQSMRVEETLDGIEGLLLSIFNQGGNIKETRIEQSRKLVEELEIYERKWLKFVQLETPNVLYAVSASYCSLGNYDRTMAYRNKIHKSDKNRLLLEDLETCLKEQSSLK